MIDDCIIRSMNKINIEPVLAWRNHPEIRRYMLSQHKISFDEHRHWFELTSQDSKRRLLIVEHTEIPIGFVHFNGVVPAKPTFSSIKFRSIPPLIKNIHLPPFFLKSSSLLTDT